jgi:hypothetical protein
MNSLAALSRAFSKSSASRSPRDAATQALAHELAAYGLAHPPPLHRSDSDIKSPDAQAAEDREGPASAYPSPPPTPELPSESTPLRSTLPKLTRQLSKKRRDGEAELVERAARSLPVRLTVAVYMLCRRLLRILGIKIAEPPLLESGAEAVELHVTPPTPAKVDGGALPPPSYEVATAAAKAKSRWGRPKLDFLHGRPASSVSSPTTSRRSSWSQSTAVAPSAGTSRLSSIMT